MKEYIISTDILSAIFMSIIAISAAFGLKSKKSSTAFFTAAVSSVIVGTILDVLSYTAEHFVKNPAVLTIINMSTYLITCFVLSFFGLYMIAVIREKTRLSYKLVIPAIAFMVANFFVVIAGTATGALFRVEDMKYVAGPWELYPYVLAVFCILYFYILLFMNIQPLGVRVTFALSTFMIAPLLLAAVKLFVNLPDVTYAASAVSLFIVYVYIQSDTIKESQLREHILNEASRVDVLTGLKNRRAFSELMEIENEKEAITTVVFCDINSLKFVNDNYGHAAGDRYIIKFAEILKEFFADREIYRISGDEFVVLLSGVTDDEAQGILEDFRKVIYENDRIAAFGYACGETTNIARTLSDAEKGMYRDKSK